jgi:UDPglucose 6-dehydrogenase
MDAKIEGTHMRLAIIGTGYVGLVSGACFAAAGNEVTCIDNNAEKIARLLRGELPIYEPGLAELVQSNQALGRLNFTTSYEPIQQADIIFLAVGTPSDDTTGATNLTALRGVVDSIASFLSPQALVVIKSTVPPGTNRLVREKLQRLTQREVDVANNPEFLREGEAIPDFQHPDRVVVGCRTPVAEQKLRELYAPFVDEKRPFLSMSPESAEMTKYVANAFLAAKISFINEMANICEKVCADIEQVRQGIGWDHRIGFEFFRPGLGYGGSCFPKDVRSLTYTARLLGVEPQLLEVIEKVNLVQKQRLIREMELHFPEGLEGKTIALWGLAFKPNTDDIREAPAIILIDHLLRAGAKLKVYDPVATDNVRRIYGKQLTYTATPLEAASHAHALTINTEWQEFKNINCQQLKQQLQQPVVFDGRNVLDPQTMKSLGFTYYSIGREPIR